MRSDSIVIYVKGLADGWPEMLCTYLDNTLQEMIMRFHKTDFNTMRSYSIRIWGKRSWSG